MAEIPQSRRPQPQGLFLSPSPGHRRCRPGCSESPADRCLRGGVVTGLPQGCGTSGPEPPESSRPARDAKGGTGATGQEAAPFGSPAIPQPGGQSWCSRWQSNLLPLRPPRDPPLSPQQLFDLYLSPERRSPIAWCPPCQARQDGGGSGGTGGPGRGHLLSRESWEVSAFMGVGSLQDLLKLRSRRSAKAAVRANLSLGSRDYLVSASHKSCRE